MISLAITLIRLAINLIIFAIKLAWTIVKSIFVLTKNLIVWILDKRYDRKMAREEAEMMRNIELESGYNF